MKSDVCFLYPNPTLQYLHTREAVRVTSMQRGCMVDLNTLFDRYSNTLFVSLNNRISIRDTYGARQAVDCQLTTSHGDSRSEATMDITLLEVEKQQRKCPMNSASSEVANADSDPKTVISE